MALSDKTDAASGGTSVPSRPGIGDKKKKQPGGKDKIIINPVIPDANQHRNEQAVLTAITRTDKEQQALAEKAAAAGIPLEILEVVYERGIVSWFEQADGTHSPQQYAFSRVASFLSGGKAWKEDVDLVEMVTTVDKTGGLKTYRDLTPRERLKNVLKVLKKIGAPRAERARHVQTYKNVFKHVTETAEDGYHRFKVVVSDPNHQMVSMRKEKIVKKIKITSTNDYSKAYERAQKHYQKQGYKVHDIIHTNWTKPANEAVQQPKAPKPQDLIPGQTHVRARGIVGIVQRAYSHPEHGHMVRFRGANDKMYQAPIKALVAEGISKRDINHVVTARDRARASTTGKVSISQAEHDAAKRLYAETKKRGGVIPDHIKALAKKMGLDEKLKAAQPASKWIHDFVHSKNSKFDGKSKKKRIQMALAAHYGANESLDEAKKHEWLNISGGYYTHFQRGRTYKHHDGRRFTVVDKEAGVQPAPGRKAKESRIKVRFHESLGEEAPGADEQRKKILAIRAKLDSKLKKRIQEAAGHYSIAKHAKQVMDRHNLNPHKEILRAFDAGRLKTGFPLYTDEKEALPGFNDVATADNIDHVKRGLRLAYKHGKNQVHEMTHILKAAVRDARDEVKKAPLRVVKQDYGAIHDLITQHKERRFMAHALKHARTHNGDALGTYNSGYVKAVARDAAASTRLRNASKKNEELEETEILGEKYFIVKDEKSGNVNYIGKDRDQALKIRRRAYHRKFRDAGNKEK